MDREEKLQHNNNISVAQLEEAEFYELLLEALDSAKPPSIWVERALFFLFGLLGGVGLGAFIIWYLA